MPRFFFDSRDNGDFIEDDEGLVLPDLEAAKNEASMALTDLAREVIPGSMNRKLSIEVRDERGSVMKALMTFEAQILPQS